MSNSQLIQTSFTSDSLAASMAQSPPVSTSGSTPGPLQASTSQASSELTQDTDPPGAPKCAKKTIITYTRRQILNLHASPLVQRPQGMPALKDWFGDWSEQHAASQAKKDSAEPNGTSGNRRFPRRDQEDGDNSARSNFRSTLSQPSQMGNFKHQSLRGDLTRGDRERERDRDKDNELRDKEGHERLRSLSDMYDRDRDRLAIPLTLPPLIRSQRDRDSAPHLAATAAGVNSGSSGRTGTRDGRERGDREKDRDRGGDREKEGGRRSENREPVRRRGGESVDWRRGADSTKGGKDDRLDPRRDSERDIIERRSRERERSPELRRDRSASRERWPGGRDRDEARDSRRENKGRERDRGERDPYSTRAWRDKDEEGKDPKDKDTERTRDRGRDDDRRAKARESESHADRDRGGRDRWADRVRDGDRGDDRRKDKDDGEKETREERRERDRDRRDRERERAREREHPDAKRDRELREGWTVAEEQREGRHPPAGNGRRGAGRGDRRQGGGTGDDDRETRKDREREKEPAWMDDYVPEAGSIKAGIFGGKIDGMEDEIQAWKKKQLNGKSRPTNGSPVAEPVPDSGVREDTSLSASIKQTSVSHEDEQAKATDAFFFGLMKGEGARAKLETVAQVDQPQSSLPSDSATGTPHVENSQNSPVANHTLTRGQSLGIPARISTPHEYSQNDPTAILLSSLHASPKTEVAKEPSPLTPASLTTIPQTQPSSLDVTSNSPLSPSSGPLSTQPGQSGSNITTDEPSTKPLSSHPSAPFNPPQQSRVLAFSSQSQSQLGPPLRSPIGPPNQAQSSVRSAGTVASQTPSTRPGAAPSQQPQQQPQTYPISQPARTEASPHVQSLTEQATQRILAAENMHHQNSAGFSPFETHHPSAFSNIESTRSPIDSSFPASRQQSITSPIESRSGFPQVNDNTHSEIRNPRHSPLSTLSSSTPSHDTAAPGQAPGGSTYASGRGSRFAKFWDVKTKEAAAAGYMQAQAAAGIMGQGVGHGQAPVPPPPPPQSASPSVPQPPRRSEQVSPLGFVGTPDNIQDMLTMLQNANQGTRLNPPGNSMAAANHLLHRQHPVNLLHEQVGHHQPQPQQQFSTASSLLDNQPFENRPFVPDGMVPGLRPPRSREAGGGLYNDGLDESPFTVQPRPQPMFEQGRPSLPQLYANQAPGANHRSAGMFQAPFRGEPSPLGGHNPLIGGQQQQQAPQQQQQPQRLPPGLANLGGRPPHDPNGYLSAMGVTGGGGVHGGGAQPPFSGFNSGLGGGGAGLGFGGPLPQQPQRSPLPMTLLNNAHNALATSGHPDFTVQHHPGVRGPPPGQMLQGPGGGGMRGGFGPQGTLGGPGQHMQPPHLGMRQQQAQHLLPQLLPPHLQQQQQPQQTSLHDLHGGGQTQNDHLLSMLMNGIGPRQ